MQVNQIHGQQGGVIEGAWPAAVDTALENLEVAAVLRDAAGLSPWANSAHCWNTQ